QVYVTRLELDEQLHRFVARSERAVADAGRIERGDVHADDMELVCAAREPLVEPSVRQGIEGCAGAIEERKPSATMYEAERAAAEQFLIHRGVGAELVVTKRRVVRNA